MGGWDWQLIVAVLIVAGAVAFLLRRLRRLLTNSSRGGCGGCAGKASGETGVRKLPLVSLEQQPPEDK